MNRECAVWQAWMGISGDWGEDLVFTAIGVIGGENGVTC